MLQNYYLLLLALYLQLFQDYYYLNFQTYLFLEYLCYINYYYLSPFYNPILSNFKSSFIIFLIFNPNFPSTITASPSPIFTPFIKISSGSFTICSSSISSPTSHLKISFRRTIFVPNLTLSFNLTLYKSSRFFEGFATPTIDGAGLVVCAATVGAGGGGGVAATSPFTPVIVEKKIEKSLWKLIKIGVSSSSNRVLKRY